MSLMLPSNISPGYKTLTKEQACYMTEFVATVKHFPALAQGVTCEVRTYQVKPPRYVPNVTLKY